MIKQSPPQPSFASYMAVTSLLFWVIVGGAVLLQKHADAHTVTHSAPSHQLHLVCTEVGGNQ